MDLGIPGIQDAVIIGQGGSAVVYRGRQAKLERTVAIKVLKGSWDSASKARFDAERRAMGRLSEDVGMVPIYEAAETASGDPYFIMPYYEEGSLQTRIEDTGPVGWAEATALVELVSETIAKAHAADIIHRDIKPANLLLDKVGRPLVGDFGIARIASDLGVETDSKHFTPAYSPPELFSFEGTSSPTIDVYGLAATLWSLLAGGPPFIRSGDSNSATLLSRVLNEPVGDLRHVAPPAICDLVERAMSKQSKDRPRSVNQFLVELRRAKGLAVTRPWKPGASRDNRRPLGDPGSIGSLNVEMASGPPPRAGLALQAGWAMSSRGAVSSAVTAIQAAEASRPSRSPEAVRAATAERSVSESEGIDPPTRQGVVGLPGRPGQSLALSTGSSWSWVIILGLLLVLCVAVVVFLAGSPENPNNAESVDFSASGLNPDPPQIRVLPAESIPEILPVGTAIKNEGTVLSDSFASPQRRIRNGTGLGAPILISTGVTGLTSNSAVVSVHSPNCISAKFSSEAGEYASASFPDSTLCGSSHKQTFAGLRSNTKYVVGITVASEGARAVRTQVEFKTASGGAPGLTITNVELAKQGPDLIGLTFATSKCAVIQVAGAAGKLEYDGWPNAAGDTCRIEHSYEVAGLESNTLYDLALSAIDVEENSVVVAYSAPTRSAVGEIVNVIDSETRQLTGSAVEVFFETDSCASSTFLFENGEVITFPACKKIHRHIRSGLQPGAKHRVDFIARSDSGQSKVETLTFATP